MRLFNRNVRLRIEDLDSSKVITVENLNVEFDIERTLEKEPSTLRATVYNLSEKTRGELEKSTRYIITLSAGYGLELHDLFIGDLRNVRHRFEGADIATDLEAGDGEKGSKNWARRSFPKNTELKKVLKYLASKAGLGAGNINKAVDIYEDRGVPTQFKNGINVRGYAIDELNEVCRSRGVEFSVQNNKVQVLEPPKALDGIPVTTLAPTTGLVGSPTLDNEGIMSADLRLLPNIFPGSSVDVDTKFVKGRFKVIRATYSGSVYGSDFNISIEGKELK